MKKSFLFFNILKGILNTPKRGRIKIHLGDANNIIAPIKPLSKREYAISNEVIKWSGLVFLR